MKDAYDSIHWPEEGNNKFEKVNVLQEWQWDFWEEDESRES